MTRRRQMAARTGLLQRPAQEEPSAGTCPVVQAASNVPRFVRFEVVSVSCTVVRSRPQS